MTKEGYPFVIPTAGISLLLFAVWIYHERFVAFLLAVVFLALSLFVIFFFRDPGRETPQGKDLILSAADGKVIFIQPFDHLEFLGGGGTMVSVFMSIFDVHVNRAPISGLVKYFKHNPGRFLPAFKDKASLENEQTELGLENGQLRVVVRQIAGIIARRIVCRVKPGDTLESGERFGMIRFGSRVDLFLPQSVELKVRLHQRVTAGETVIGVFQKCET
ncbi:MAG: phosphatidylserine decarboxylase family protein [Candidatus Zixiibacteriota bacterium]